MKNFLFNKFIVMTLCFITISHFGVKAQDFCYTPSDSPDIIQSFRANAMLVPAASYNISVFFHIICKLMEQEGLLNLISMMRFQ